MGAPDKAHKPRQYWYETVPSTFQASSVASSSVIFYLTCSRSSGCLPEQIVSARSAITVLRVHVHFVKA